LGSERLFILHHLSTDGGKYLHLLRYFNSFRATKYSAVGELNHDPHRHSDGLPAMVCAAPDTVKILFLNMLCTQQLSTDVSTVAAMMDSPIHSNTSAAFHHPGKTSDSVARP